MATNPNRLITVNGKNLYLEHHNHHENQPSFVFLHDSLGCVALWRDFPEKIGFATHCNTLVYDRLGYGKSDPMPTSERPVQYLELEADVLNEVLTTLNIHNAIVFGHSDGGSIALLAASKYPERIKAVICEAAHIFVEDITLKGIHDAITAYQNTNLAERLQKYHGDKVDTLFKAWTETWTRNDFKNWTIEDFLPAITCPLLFIQGDADEYGSLNQVEHTIRQVKGKAEKFILPNIGHTPHKDAPEAVISRVAAFVQDIASPSK